MESDNKKLSDDTLSSDENSLSNDQQSQPMVSANPNETDNVKTPKELYFEQLAIWVQQANLSLNAMNCFPYYLMTNYPHLLNAQGLNQPGPFGPNTSQIDQSNLVTIINRARVRPENLLDGSFRSEEIINQNGGYEYVIAPLWKRFVAEIIDVCILFIIKLIVAFMIIDIFEIDFGFDFDAIRSSIEDDYTEFLIFSSEMIYVEIITKVFVCIYEAMWTRQGQRHMGGATPGKILMGIRILYVEAVVPLEAAQNLQGQQLQFNNIGQQQPLRALLFPAQNPGFKRAFSRAFSKNLLMALLFPLCFVMLFFRNNRTSYDIMTKTIVVEENPAPILRRIQIRDPPRQ